jgi:hypothetical protein
VFLLLAIGLGIGGANLLAAAPDAPPPAAAFGFIVGACLAWFVSGIPIYYWRYQLTGTILGHPVG